MSRHMHTLRNAVAALALCGLTVPAPLMAQAQSTAEKRASDPRYFGGIWQIERFVILINDAPMLPHTKKQREDYVKAMNEEGKILFTAWTSCRAGAPSSMAMAKTSVVVLQKDDDITASFDEPRMTRRIYMNAEHPANLESSYMGHSVGRWEGNTLVVDTIGYNGLIQLDAFGLPTSTKLRTTERWTKSADGKRVDVKITIDDPEYFSEPFVAERAWVATSERFQTEYDCMENPRAEEFTHTVFVKDLFRPACVSYQGEGEAPSKILCRKQEEQAEMLRNLPSNQR